MWGHCTWNLWNWDMTCECLLTFRKLCMSTQTQSRRPSTYMLLKFICTSCWLFESRISFQRLLRFVWQVDDAEQNVDSQTALIAQSWRSKLGWHLGDIVAPETSTKTRQTSVPQNRWKVVTWLGVPKGKFSCLVDGRRVSVTWLGTQQLGCWRVDGDPMR